MDDLSTKDTCFTYVPSEIWTTSLQRTLALLMCHLRYGRPLYKGHLLQPHANTVVYYLSTSEIRTTSLYTREKIVGPMPTVECLHWNYNYALSATMYTVTFLASSSSFFFCSAALFLIRAFFQSGVPSSISSSTSSSAFVPVIIKANESVDHRLPCVSHCLLAVVAGIGQSLFWLLSLSPPPHVPVLSIIMYQQRKSI